MTITDEDKSEDMITWTKAGAEAWRMRHPNKRSQRIAGAEAYYEGEKITRLHTCYDGFLERGWIYDSGVDAVCKAEINQCTARFNGGLSTETQREDRWRLMQSYCARRDINTLIRLSIEMGFSDSDTVTKFCRKYGRDLAKKLGKLPNVETLNRGIWLEIMEQE